MKLLLIAALALLFIGFLAEGLLAAGARCVAEATLGRRDLAR